MKIGCFIKESLTLYPGKRAAGIYTQGCNFRCVTCERPDLIPAGPFDNWISEEDVLGWLRSECSRIEGVVIDGGEPTLQPDLIGFMTELWGLGYSLKLHTNGSNPEVLQKLIDLKLADFLEMEVKAPLDKYDLIAGVEVNIDNIRRSSRIIIESGVDYQFRTAMSGPYLDAGDAKKMAVFLRHAKRYSIEPHPTSAPIRP